jgi:hypothetical protein
MTATRIALLLLLPALAVPALAGAARARRQGQLVAPARPPLRTSYPARQVPEAPLVTSTRSGRWSEAATWSPRHVPAAGERVLIRAGHTVVYDLDSDHAIRVVHVAGTLTFARDRNTRLDVGLLRIQPDEAITEDGFDCDLHAGPAATPPRPAKKPLPALLVGTLEEPVPAAFRARIRLVALPGMNPETTPAIVACGGRMEFHGAPLSQTWVKLAASAGPGQNSVTVAEPVTGWRAGDRVIVTASKRGEGLGISPDEPENIQTELRTIRAVKGSTLLLDAPLAREHYGTGEFRSEVANLSRNVVVESADPAGVRGHTMYHRGSQGNISYAEFAHLGKKGVLGKYPIHFHLVGDSMRGASVVGASIWDSQNRWLTIHGTNYLVVRDCVGYRSLGHGFYFEDGTEVYNVLDHNLAVNAFAGKRLPKQVLGYDGNDGAGFWWANNHNSLTRNVSCENNQYGFHGEAVRTSGNPLEFAVLRPTGERPVVDIRTLPFVRFEGNEAHSDGLYGIKLDHGDRACSLDLRHPNVLRDSRIWEVHYAYRPTIPCVLTEGMTIWRAVYGVYHPDYDHHVYRNLRLSENTSEPFNRAHDDESYQNGPFSVDNLLLENCRIGRDPLIQLTCTSPTGRAAGYFRHLQLHNNRTGEANVVNLGGGPRRDKIEHGVPYYFFDHFGPGRTALVASLRAADLLGDGHGFFSEPGFTGPDVRIKEVEGIAFPELLAPVDDEPPATIITSLRREGNRLVARGVTADNGVVKRVLVNGKEAKALRPNFAEWEAALDPAAEVTAYGVDAAGNVERLPHRRSVE